MHVCIYIYLGVPHMLHIEPIIGPLYSFQRERRSTVLFALLLPVIYYILALCLCPKINITLAIFKSNWFKSN